VDELENQLQAVTQMMSQGLKDKAQSDDHLVHLEAQLKSLNKLLAAKTSYVNLEPSLPFDTTNMYWCEILANMVAIRRVQPPKVESGVDGTSDKPITDTIVTEDRNKS